MKPYNITEQSEDYEDEELQPGPSNAKRFRSEIDARGFYLVDHSRGVFEGRDKKNTRIIVIDSLDDPDRMYKFRWKESEETIQRFICTRCIQHGRETMAELRESNDEVELWEQRRHYDVCYWDKAELYRNNKIPDLQDYIPQDQKSDNERRRRSRSREPRTSSSRRRTPIPQSNSSNSYRSRRSTSRSCSSVPTLQPQDAANQESRPTLRARSSTPNRLSCQIDGSYRIVPFGQYVLGPNERGKENAKLYIRDRRDPSRGRDYFFHHHTKDGMEAYFCRHCSTQHHYIYSYIGKTGEIYEGPKAGESHLDSCELLIFESFLNEQDFIKIRLERGITSKINRRSDNGWLIFTDRRSTTPGRSTRSVSSKPLARSRSSSPSQSQRLFSRMRASNRSGILSSYQASPQLHSRRTRSRSRAFSRSRSPLDARSEDSNDQNFVSSRGTFADITKMQPVSSKLCYFPQGTKNFTATSELWIRSRHDQSLGHVYLYRGFKNGGHYFRCTTCKEVVAGGRVSNAFVMLNDGKIDARQNPHYPACLPRELFAEADEGPRIFPRRPRSRTRSPSRARSRSRSSAGSRCSSVGEFTPRGKLPDITKMSAVSSKLCYFPQGVQNISEGSELWVRSPTDASQGHVYLYRGSKAGVHYFRCTTCKSAVSGGRVSHVAITVNDDGEIQAQQNRHYCTCTPRKFSGSAVEDEVTRVLPRRSRSRTRSPSRARSPFGVNSRISSVGGFLPIGKVPDITKMSEVSRELCYFPLGLQTLNERTQLWVRSPNDPSMGHIYNYKGSKDGGHFFRCTTCNLRIHNGVRSNCFVEVNGDQIVVRGNQHYTTCHPYALHPWADGDNRISENEDASRYVLSRSSSPIRSRASSRCRSRTPSTADCSSVNPKGRHPHISKMQLVPLELCHFPNGTQAFDANSELWISVSGNSNKGHIFVYRTTRGNGHYFICRSCQEKSANLKRSSAYVEVNGSQVIVRQNEHYYTCKPYELTTQDINDAPRDEDSNIAQVDDNLNDIDDISHSDDDRSRDTAKANDLPVYDISDDSNEAPKPKYSIPRPPSPPVLESNPQPESGASEKRAFSRLQPSRLVTSTVTIHHLIVYFTWYEKMQKKIGFSTGKDIPGFYFWTKLKDITHFNERSRPGDLQTLGDERDSGFRALAYVLGQENEYGIVREFVKKYLIENYYDDAPGYINALIKDDLLPTHLSVLAEALEFRIAVFSDDKVELYGNTPHSAILLLSYKNGVYALVKTLK